MIRTSEQLFYVSRFSNISVSLIVQFVKICRDFVFSAPLNLKGHWEFEIVYQRECNTEMWKFLDIFRFSTYLWILSIYLKFCWIYHAWNFDIHDSRDRFVRINTRFSPCLRAAWEFNFAMCCLKKHSRNLFLQHNWPIIYVLRLRGSKNDVY